MASPLQSDCHIHAVANLVDTLAYLTNSIDKLTMAQIQLEDWIEVLMKSGQDLANDMNKLRFVACTCYR